MNAEVEVLREAERSIRLDQSDEFMLAVANLLGETAADLDALMTYGGHGPAVAVARAYLGSDS